MRTATPIGCDSWDEVGEAKPPLGSYSLGRRSYPVVASPRCRTCRSPHRRAAECLVAEGKPYAYIARSLPADAGLTPKNIREHCRRGHVPVQQEVLRQIADQVGGDHAAVLEQGVAQAIRGLATATVVVAEVEHRVRLGELDLTVKDGLRASRMLLDYELALRRDRDLEGHLRDSHRAIKALLGIARDHAEPGAWSAMLQAMEAESVVSDYLGLLPPD